MLLAAGRGQRMRPLSDHTPKPLLHVRGRPLLDWHIAALTAAGVGRIVVNTGWLGAQVAAHVQRACTATRPRLHCSREEVDCGHALETAGGIARALPLLPDVFWLAAGDVYAPDFPFAEADRLRFASSGDLAHVWLVPNPAHHPGGDFILRETILGSGTGRAALPPAATDAGDGPCMTYSTIALLHAQLFDAQHFAAAFGADTPEGRIRAGNPEGTPAALAPLLRHAIRLGRVGASLYSGAWTDVGTPQRLAALNAAHS